MSVTPSYARSQADHRFFIPTREEGILGKHAAEGVSLELKIWKKSGYIFMTSYIYIWNLDDIVNFLREK